jgi:hypothetical protein
MFARLVLKLAWCAIVALDGFYFVFVRSWVAVQTIDGTSVAHVRTFAAICTPCFLGFILVFSFGTILTRDGPFVVFKGPWSTVQTVDGTVTTHVLPSNTLCTRCISRQNLMSANLTRFTLGGASIDFVRSRIAIQTIHGTTNTHVLSRITIDARYIIS